MTSSPALPLQARALLIMNLAGYYLLHRTNISGMNTLFAQLWKEYALSDSRYLTSDVFTVCVETITVVSTSSWLLKTLVRLVRRIL